MEVNDGKGLGKLIIFYPQRTDNRALEVDTQRFALLKPQNRYLSIAVWKEIREKSIGKFYF